MNARLFVAVMGLAVVPALAAQQHPAQPAPTRTPAAPATAPARQATPTTAPQHPATAPASAPATAAHPTTAPQHPAAATAAHPTTAPQHPATAPASAPAAAHPTTTAPARQATPAPAPAQGARPAHTPPASAEIAPDTVTHIEYRREVYSYQGGQRDPFLSLASTSDVGPQIGDLRLVSIVYDARGGRSVAIVRDRNNPHSYRLRRGDQVGRLRVVQIRQYEVVFQVEEFGFEREETLRLTRPEANQ